VVDEKDGNKMQGDEMHKTMKHFSLLTFDGDHICHVNGGDDNCDEMQCELMIEVVILTPKNKDMIMVIVKSDSGSNLSI
jgi:hypothetical protein